MSGAGAGLRTNLGFDTKLFKLTVKKYPFLLAKAYFLLITGLKVFEVFYVLSFNSVIVL